MKNLGPLPVRFPQRSLWPYVVFVAFWGLVGLQGVALWFMSGAAQRSPWWVAVLVFAAWGVSAIGLVIHVRRMARGDLVWNGHAWSFAVQGCASELQIARLRVVLDLQTSLWLSLHPSQGGVRWLWLSKRECPARWGDLRRAVYSRANQ